MRRSNLGLAALVGIASLPAPTQALGPLEEVYVSPGALAWTYETEDGAQRSATGGRLAIGALLNAYYGVEGHLGMYGEDDSDDQHSYRLDSLDSVLLRLNGPLTGWFHVYLLAGFSDAQMIHLPESFDAEEDAPSAQGPTLGIGAELRLGERWALRGDVIRYVNEPDFILDGTTGSITARF